MRRWIVGTVAVAAASMVIGCSDDEDPKAGEGDACTVDGDCASGLLCRESVCVPSANNGNNTNNGNNSNNSNNGNNVNNIVDEEYFISYIYEDVINSTRRLRLLNNLSGDTVDVSPEEVDCGLGCWVTEDLSNFIYLRPNMDPMNAGTFDVYRSDVGTDLTAASGGEVVASAVRSVEVNGNDISYVREVTMENQAFYLTLGSGEVNLGRIGTVGGTEGDWHADPNSGNAVIYNPTLQTMDVLIGDTSGGITDVTYTIDSQNYQEVSGSYFGGNVDTAFSPDGKYMAMLTSKAPMDTNACTSAADCTGVGERCGRFDRCASIQVVVHMFDMENLDNLGERCGGNEACGSVHTCDIPADTQIDKAVCIPRRIVLGLPAEQTQGTPAQTGCQLTSGRDDLFYTGVRGPLSFGADGSLYAVATRDCDDQNIPISRILRMQPTSSDFEVVYGNPGDAFDDALCYDEEESQVDTENCIIEIQSARLSPGGNKLAFTGTNPNVVDADLAATTMDLWEVKRDGTDHEWTGGNGELDVVERFQVHPAP